VIEHGCATDPSTFEVTCQSTPATGATVAGGGVEATTGADGTAQLTAAASGRLKLTATRGTDIPSQALRVCVKEDIDLCPKRHGERIVGSADGEKIKGTKGPDVIRGRGGDDRIDVRGGEVDKVDCGPGEDKVLVRRGDEDADRLAGDCERPRRR
jgi:Ca2+-binding RTX toxin-like protein